MQAKASRFASTLLKDAVLGHVSLKLWNYQSIPKIVGANLPSLVVHGFPTTNVPKAPGKGDYC